MTPTRYQLTPVPFTAVHFSDPFWAPRIETNYAATITHIYRKLEETGCISAYDLNFERPVPSPIVLIFGDSDPAKWIEAASYSLATHPDPELAGLVDRVANKMIAAQQQATGERKLLNTYHAIWWPAAASVTGIFLMHQHFYAIPRDLKDAALVDGAGCFRIYWQVCLPLVRGAMVALSIFTFLVMWNDLFWLLIVLSERNMMTLPVGLIVIQQGSYIQRGLAFAGAFIASMPVLIFYAIFQRRIIAGITTTGMAGQ